MAKIGLRVRDRVTGAITLDITDRLTRVLGSVNTGTSAGSISVPEFIGNQPFFIVSETVRDVVNFGPSPTVTISGSTLSWTFSGIPSRPTNPARIIYGLY